MPENPLKALIDRDSLPALVVEHFAPQVELLKQLVNYGSNLVMRAYTSSPKDMSDVIICGVLLKQVVAMLDAFQVLISAGNVNAAQLQLRAELEASLYLEWMLVSDKELKGRHYYVFNLRRKLLWVGAARGDWIEAK